MIAEGDESIMAGHGGNWSLRLDGRVKVCANSPRWMMASHLAGTIWMQRVDGLVPVVTLIPILILYNLPALSRHLLRDEVDVTDQGQC